MERSFLMLMLSLRPTMMKELNYFLAWSSGNISGTRLGVSSYGLKISFLEEDSKGSIDGNFLGVNDDDAFDIDFEFHSDFRNLI